MADAVVDPRALPAWPNFQRAVTGKIAPAAWGNDVLDGLAILKTSVNDDGTLHGCRSLLHRRTGAEAVLGNVVGPVVLYTYTVPGGKLGANGTLVVSITGRIDMTVISHVLTVTLKYGGVVICTGPITGTSATVGGFRLVAEIIGNGVTNQQRAVTTVQHVLPGAAPADGQMTPAQADLLRVTSHGNLTLDSNAPQAIEFSAQWDTPAPTLLFRVFGGLTELVTP